MAQPADGAPFSVGNENTRAERLLMQPGNDRAGRVSPTEVAFADHAGKIDVAGYWHLRPDGESERERCRVITDDEYRPCCDVLPSLNAM